MIRMAKPQSGRARRAGRREVALAFPIAPAHLFAVTRGVTDFASQHGRWFITTHGESANLPIQRLRGWKGDGIIAILTSPGDVVAARRFWREGIPVVTFSATLSRPGVPRVRTDSTSIGRLAAEHLLRQDYEHFALCGLRGVAYSEDRGRAFAERLAINGLKCSTLVSPSTFAPGRPWENEIRSVSRWINSLRRPVGVFAVNDYRAQLVASACKSIGLRIPQEVGIIGVDNNHVICEFSSPTLTSVDCNWYDVGRRAAELLNRLMNGQPQPREDLIVPPIGVIQRSSTQRIAASDARLNAARDYVRDHPGEIFGVERLVQAAKCPRRTLELAFARELNCTPADYLNRQRIDRAKRMLQSSEATTLSEISLQCGFRDLRRFRLVFRRYEKISPAEFRDSQRRAL